MKKFIFTLLSIIFHPILMPLYGIMFIVNLNGHISIMTNELKKFILIKTFIFTTLIPVILYFLITILEKINIIKASENLKRKFIILLSFFSFYAGYISLKKFGISLIYPIFLLAVSFTTLITYIINIFYKISLHSTGISGLLAFMLFLAIRQKIDTLFMMLLIVFITSLLFIARIGLKAHTPAEFIGGLLTGFSSVFLFTYFFT